MLYYISIDSKFNNGSYAGGLRKVYCQDCLAIGLDFVWKRAESLVKTLGIEDNTILSQANIKIKLSNIPTDKNCNNCGKTFLNEKV